MGVAFDAREGVVDTGGDVNEVTRGVDAWDFQLDETMGTPRDQIVPALTWSSRPVILVHEPLPAYR